MKFTNPVRRGQSISFGEHVRLHEMPLWNADRTDYNPNRVVGTLPAGCKVTVTRSRVVTKNSLKHVEVRVSAPFMDAEGWTAVPPEDLARFHRAFRRTVKVAANSR